MRITRRQATWAVQRLLFEAYMVFCLVTIVGGWLTAPLFTHLILGDWRFWRHLRVGFGCWLHGFRFATRVIRGKNQGFMFSLPLTAPPFSGPNLAVVALNPTWENGTSCGGCTRCCDINTCPVLDKERKLCRGYDAFFWRYFNCGRFPSAQREVDYYGCPKWTVPDRKEATTWRSTTRS